MALSKERKEQLAEHLRGTSVAKENITPEYRKNLELADKETVVIPVGENDEVTCYIFYGEEPDGQLPGTYQCPWRGLRPSPCGA